MRTVATLLTAAGLTLLATAPAAADEPKPAEYQFFEDAVEGELGAGAPLSDGAAGGQLGTGRMRAANRAAAEILKVRMARTRGADLSLLKGAASADVVVVSGQYDRVQDALAAMGVKHVVLPPSLLGKLDLLATQTLMVNCPGTVPAEAVGKVRAFVARGGYLVTTDWALKNLTERAFPGTIRHNGVLTADDVVAVHTHDPDEPLLAHVKLMADSPRWWLEGSSYPIEVLDPRRVDVLMSSEEMKQKYGEGAMMVAFRHGDGRVLHMTSHFYLQQSKLVAASEKAKGSKFAAGAGMTSAEIDGLKDQGVDVDAVSTGALSSAYSMQQLSTNLLVSKQKANKALLARYRGEAIVDDLALQATPGATGVAAKPKRVKKGFRLQVLEEREGELRVRDLFGNEGWVPAAAVRR